MKKRLQPWQYLTFGFLGALAPLVAIAAPMVSMPGHSFNGPLPQLTPLEQTTSTSLRTRLTYLAGKLGERNFLKAGTLKKSADYIASSFSDLLLPGATIERQPFKWEGIDYENVILEIKGDSSAGVNDIVVIGAHYDTVGGCPGADDNGSGVVGMIELARILGQSRHNKTLRFVAFANEEFQFRTHGMGSYQYAARCHEKGEKIAAMVALETIGCYSDKKGSQQYPPPIGLLYPDTGNFIAFVGNDKNQTLVRDMVGSFRQNCHFPSEGIAAPSAVPGIDWSDHLPFWQFGYPGLMITDTAPYRNPCYHEACDTVDKIDFDKMARVVGGLVVPISQLTKS